MRRERREIILMPSEIIVVALITAAFGAFAATLFWVDLRTRELSK